MVTLSWHLFFAVFAVILLILSAFPKLVIPWLSLFRLGIAFAFVAILLIQ